MLSIFFVAIALSMDAFSVAISLGIINTSNKYNFFMPIVVGIMHFFMPLFGFLLGNQIFNIFNFNPKIIISIIFFYLATVMLLDKDKREVNISTLITLFLISFSVSLDSFTVGIGLNALTNNYLLAFFTFSLFSCCFTYLGILLGKYSAGILQKRSSIIGITILYGLALVNLCQVFS